MTPASSAHRFVVGLIATAAVALAGPSRTRAISPQQPAPPSTIDGARVEDALKQAEALLGRRANDEVIALLSPLLNESSAHDPVLDANVQYSLGRAYDNASRFAEAVEHYQRALDGFRAAGNRRSEARALRTIAQVHKNTGAYQRGLEFGQQALAIYTELGETRDIALTHVVIGAVHDSVGDHRRALENFERALPLLESQKSHDLVNVLNEIGITQKNLGRYTEALNTYSRGLDIAREIKDTSGASFLALNLAVLHDTIGETELGVERGLEALTLTRESGNRRGESIVLENLASEYWSLGNQERAIESLQSVLRVTREMGTRNQEGIVLKDLGDIYAERGDVALAQQRYEEALAVQRATGERKSVASTLAGMSDLNLRAGHPDQALSLAEESLAIAGDLARPELEWTARRAVALAAAAGGQTDRAIDELRASTRIINDLRANVASDMSKVAFVDRRQDVFGDLAALLVASRRAGEALEAAEAGRARAFADLLKQRQIEGKATDRVALATVRRAEDDYERALAAPVTQPVSGPAARSGLRGGELLVKSVSSVEAGHHELVSLITAESPTIADIRVATGRLHATLVEYLVTDRHTLVWVVGPDGEVHGVSIDVTREQLTPLVATLRRSIDATANAPASHRAPAPYAALRELDRRLVAPINAWLPASPDQPVIIVPHGPLALVPFAALEDESGRPLIERHVLSFAPAAAVFAYTETKHLAASAARDRGVLVVADPTPPPGSGLQRLPWARQEGQRVARRLRNRPVRLLAGSDASEAAVKREAGAYSILHFATHGLISPERPLASSLALGAGAGEDGYLRVDEIFNLELAADLVVLSGCSTGLGKLTGDGIVGLTRAFLYAGTPTVIVSQWNVSDRTTSILMDEFYSKLGQGLSKAQGLRAAALSVRKQFPDPAFWAAFEVVGEP